MEADSNNQPVVPNKGPNDFIFGRVLGEGSFSTVSKDISSILTF